jgi:hypothetical protein
MPRTLTSVFGLGEALIVTVAGDVAVLLRGDRTGKIAVLDGLATLAAGVASRRGTGSRGSRRACC